jgi:predicted RNA binding protein YcfA (HicA-like mRNA interferase family)
MPKLKVLSVREILRIYEGFGFFITRTKGSHIQLLRILPENGHHQILTVPNHPTLKKRAIHGIYRESLRYLNDEDIRKYFYSE